MKTIYCSINERKYSINIYQMLKTQNLKLLDCTLRDGGYYNNWNFDIKKANKYLKSSYSANIDIIELGFKFLEKNQNYGPFAFVDTKLIKKIPKNKKTKIAIMINADDFLKIKGNYKTYLNKLFKKKSDLEIIRIAVRFKDYKMIMKYINHLKSLNYKICFNLMQINNISATKLKKCLRDLKLSKSVDVFYFADSFGNLTPLDVKKICKIIKKNWDKEIGIHSHDNCGLALRNCIEAFKSGVTWIDGTIQGMGRGAGNAKTENLLNYFKKYNYNPKAINSISNSYFSDLREKYNWGKSKYYRLAAKYDIHPTYIQMLQADKRYSSTEIMQSINSLKKIIATSYDPKTLERSFIDDKNIIGNWNAEGFLDNKNVIILGYGPSLKHKKNINKIKKCILKYKCAVLSININNFIPDYLIDFYVSSNETRISLDHQKYNSLKKPIIIPKNKLKRIKKNFTKINFLDYGMTIKNNKFLFDNNYSIVPYNLTFAYAMALVFIGRAKKIFIAGFDGYKQGQREQVEMQKTIDLIYKSRKSLILNSLTKTSYKL
jgi:4-hydroxy 2-oxovalerate aldolase